jgi:hypothetical protein
MNYKQIVLSVVTFSLAISIPYVTAYAQVVKTVPTPTGESGLIPAPTPVDYQLPYPGMLPDNPLYFLKQFRDDVTAFFLSKPIDKADFYLLQSDKNVQASYLLATQHQGKADLSLQTYAHAQSDFEQAIMQTANSKKQGYSTQELVRKLASSNLKHVQILQAIAQAAGQNDTQTVRDERNRALTITKEIKSL